jgi:hypothetical protein
MRHRRLYLLFALLALLALATGAASVLILIGFEGGVKASTGLIAARTPQSLAVASTREPVPTRSESAATTVALAEPTTLATQEAHFQPPEDTHTPTQVVPVVPAQVAPTEVVAVASSTEAPIPALSPAANRVGGPVDVPESHAGRRWVTLQAGHWHIQDLPIELQHLAGDTGTYGGGVSEVDLNIGVAQRTAQLLADRGFNVEILDATVPVSYTTDLFLAIHADGNAWTGMRGFKAVAPWVSVPASDKFVGIFYEEYGKATGLPTDPVTSVAMADYYAFNPITYHHAIDPRVPAALIEMGFVTNPLDRQVMAQEQDKVAWGIANSVDRFFRSGAVGDTPTPYPSFTPTITPTFTPTSTPTPTNTATSTPTQTATPIPDCGPQVANCGLPAGTAQPAVAATQSAAPLQSQSTIRNPQSAIPTPTPTPTPLQGIITADGRWLPPLSPNDRSLPQPGSNSPPVFLSQDVDEPVMTPDGRERQQVWQQFYMPQLGRSVWQKGPLLYVRP